jgi:glutathione peroxidase
MPDSQTSLYDIPLRRIDGTATTLGALKGKVLLVTNVASRCGLTPPLGSASHPRAPGPRAPHVELAGRCDPA